MDYLKSIKISEVLRANYGMGYDFEIKPGDKLTFKAETPGGNDVTRTYWVESIMNDFSGNPFVQMRKDKSGVRFDSMGRLRTVCWRGGDINSNASRFRCIVKYITEIVKG